MKARADKLNILIVAMVLAACSDQASYETIEPGQNASIGGPRSDDASGVAPEENANSSADGEEGSADDDKGGVSGADQGKGKGAGEKKVNPSDEIGSSDGGPKDPGGKGDGTGGGDPKPKPEDEVKRSCETLTKKTLEQKVVFKDPGRTCDWKKGTNLSTKDLEIRARREQFSPLAGLDEAVICSMKFDFPAQEMRYDDEIFLLFNNVVMASSIDYSAKFEPKDGLSFYDWMKIRGTAYTAREKAPYCLGQDKGLGKCVMPYTETRGPMSLAYDPAVIYKISAATDLTLDGSIKTSLSSVYTTWHGDPMAPAADDFTDKARGRGFTFVTVGDNNSSDCQHKDFEFSVTIQYIDKPAKK